MTRIKICGITTLDDARAAVNAGVHALGFNFSKASPRYIDKEQAQQIIGALPPFIASVGVFVEQEPDEINEICTFCSLEFAQLHSERYTAEKSVAVTATKVIRVFRTGPDFTIEDVKTFTQETGITSFLFDAYRHGQPGGTGVRIEKDIAQQIFRGMATVGTSILAGGLNQENVTRAIRETRPYAVDTASGVETSPGRKDHKKIRSFVRAVQEADRSS